jgi:hypothetical protein
MISATLPHASGRDTAGFAADVMMPLPASGSSRGDRGWWMRSIAWMPTGAL